MNGKTLEGIDTLVFLNNAISVRLAEAYLRERNVELGRVALVLLKPVPCSWGSECAVMVAPEAAASRLTRLRQASRFYRRAASLTRRVLQRCRLRRILLVNNDNLLTGHALRVADESGVEVVVVAEGIMNYQDITLRNRGRWRQVGKRLTAPLLGLRWRAPQTHLSGAWEAPVTEVLSFASAGLHAPAHRQVIRPFRAVSPAVEADPSSALIAVTGLWQWMTPEQYARIATAFAEWIREQNFSRIWIKPHPFVGPDPLLELIPEYELVTTRASLEELAPQLPAATVVGTCCTALITLKMLRPDVRCVDFGSDHYCEWGYHGDRGVQDVLRAVGVDLVQMPQPV